MVQFDFIQHGELQTESSRGETILVKPDQIRAGEVTKEAVFVSAERHTDRYEVH